MDALRKIPKDVLVVGGTSHPWKIQNLLKEGFNNLIFMPEPDLDARKGILKHNLETRFKLKRENVDALNLDVLAKLTEGFTASDISRLCEWALNNGPATQENLESKAAKYKTTQLDEWTGEAKANKEKLDSEAFSTLKNWLEKKKA